MKKVNFFTLLFITTLSINIFIYVDIISQLILKTAGLYIDKVTILDSLLDSLLTIIFCIIPILIISILLTKIIKNKKWLIVIFLAYSSLWLLTSFLIVSSYIFYYGHTWLKHEIFFFMLEQNHFFKAYLISLLYLLILTIYNLRKKKTTC